ncbi:hypothetical protein PG901_13525, partial [Psychrobacter sp. ANT_H3]|nr:hypothetical protein [Psychrobacter sp. ANT_H3]
EDWLRWCKAGGFELPNNIKINHFSHVLLAIEAARYNLGVTLVNNYMMLDKSYKQKLIRIPMHELLTGDKFYFVYKELKNNQDDIIKLSKWLESQCE